MDSHKALPVLPFTRARLDSIELYPFRKAIRAGLGGMMVGHLEVPTIEPQKGLPSSLSRKVVSGLLVNDLGFQGLVFTDALAMKGVSGNESICLQALKAGNVELAEKLLGYRYRTEGVVEHGQKLGRTLGFPTLNVAWKPEKAAPPVWRICMQSKNGWNLVLRNRQSGDQTDGNGCKTDFDRGVCI